MAPRRRPRSSRSRAPRRSSSDRGARRGDDEADDHDRARDEPGTTSESASTSCLSPEQRDGRRAGRALRRRPHRRGRARCRAPASAGYMSAASRTARITVPAEAPTRARPRTTSGVDDPQAAERDGHRGDDPRCEATGDHRHSAVAVHGTAGGQRGERGRREEDRRPEADDAPHVGDENERRRPDGDGDLHHPARGGEARGEEDRVPPNGKALRRHSKDSITPVRNARAPPCDGWRTYGPPNRLRDAADGDRAPSACASQRNGNPPSISARVGRRLVDAVPGCVGTTFQSRTSCSIPSSARTPWTMVAVDSAGPVPSGART